MPEAGHAKRSGKQARAKRGDKKRHFLDCARQLFAAFGYASVGIEQIAEKAGVSRAVLVRVYPDKSSFLTGIGDDWLESLFPQEDVSEQTVDIVTRLLNISERFRQSLRDDRATARIVLSGLAEEVEDEESVLLHSILQKAIERLLPTIIEGQQSGVIRRDIDPQHSAGDWLRFFLGAALLPFPEPKDGDIPTLMIETLLHGVLKTDV